MTLQVDLNHAILRQQGPSGAKRLLAGDERRGLPEGLTDDRRHACTRFHHGDPAGRPGPGLLAAPWRP
ncbi:hypothetical protein, partial [Kocuria flava]|uniref:hypothetical protein n=1 Tax=Kocuria flava TaxID=446860 RepID=UPI001C5F9429